EGVPEELDDLLGPWLVSCLVVPSGVLPRPRLNAITQATRTSRQAAMMPARRSMLVPGACRLSSSSSSTYAGRTPLPVPTPVPVFSHGQNPPPPAPWVT